MNKFGKNYEQTSNEQLMVLLIFYNVIQNNTNFLFNAKKNPKIEKYPFEKDALNEDEFAVEANIPEQEGGRSSTLKFLFDLFKDERGVDTSFGGQNYGNGIDGSHGVSGVGSFSSISNVSNVSNVSSSNSNSNSNLSISRGEGDDDGGDGKNNNEGEEERRMLFKRAMELKKGSKNVKKNVPKCISILQNLISEKRDKITSSSYYELGKIYFFGFKNYFFCHKRNIKLCLYYLEKSAELKNPAALHFLSFIYFYEFHQVGEPDENKGLTMSSGDSSSGGFSGIMNGNISGNVRRSVSKRGRGNISDKEYAKKNNIRMSIEYELIACMFNYTPALLSLAYKYLYGINIKQNYDKAKEYYKRVAETVMNSDYINIPLSELDILNGENLNMHNEINNLKNNEEDILEFLNEQIKGGDVMAMYDLGKKYKEEKNFTKAFQYINEASKKNNLLALKELGIIYLYGYGAPRDIDKSIENFSKAAEAGDVESKCYLGYIYYFIDEYKNVKLSLKYLTEAANHDYGEAFFFLAEIILDISIKKRYISDYVYKVVFKLYEHSADLGYVQAYFREAQLYEIGKGVKESCLNATLSYKFVSESTLWTNKIRQGLLERMNYYIEKDYLKSFYTYALASYEGYEVAQSNLIYIYKNNKLENFVKREKIMLMLNLLYSQGNYRALYEIGEMYKKQKKENLSISFYKLGLKKGDLRNLLPLSAYYEKNMQNDRALRYINHYIKQRKREKEQSNTKMEMVKSLLDSSMLYFRKYKLILKNLYNSKQKKKS
ncbi:ubiquitin-protein ligase [Plasmodium brasilianum]|uniref:Ubiquitin-protein ligase n=1 Tax=Plasmodium brasilianum TaxID=5824 RepID=A0ACB9YA45_PLABR|nr:ubiquitin-protein ligase [Plasmodium brasilianum]